MNATLKKILWPLVITRRWHENYLRKHNPEKLFSIWHKRSTGKYLNIDNPQTLDDKIAYMAFRTDTTEWTRLADKVRVREYVEACGYGAYLPKLYGTWERAEDIDFEKLPNAFVIKTNNASATNILIRDKRQADLKKIRIQLNEWLKIDYGYRTCQPHYSRIKPLILAEEFLGLEEDMGGVVDYKFFCVNGAPQFIQIMSERKENSHCFNVNIMDLDWQAHPEYCSKQHPLANNIQRPQSLGLMVEIAIKLSTGLPFVRVDFYEIGNRPIFGEMTFTPGFSSLSHEFQNKVGKQLKI